MSVREPADPRRDPDGRHCEMTRAHPEAIALGQLRERSEDVTLVREGFSHAHEDDVAEALRGRGRQSARFPPAPHHLRRDLAHGQVVAKTHLARRAEGAPHRAAGLRRHADRDAVSIPHQDGLDHVRPAEPEKRLPGRAPVGGPLIQELDADRKRTRQALPERRRNVRHLLVGRPGAECAVAVDAPGAVGSFDDPTSFVARDPMVALAWRDHRTVLLTRADPFPVLVAAVLEQKVMGTEARTAWRRVVRMTADEAPGDHGLRLPPDAERVASLPPSELTKLGVTGTRAATLREVARHPKKIAALAGAPFNEARSWLRRLPGVGPWTEAEVARLALGDPDAVSVGDFHLPNIVAWALAGETRGTDDRMLELLEPYRGQRARVQLLLEASGITAPRLGPKLARRTFF